MHLAHWLSDGKCNHPCRILPELAFLCVPGVIEPKQFPTPRPQYQKCTTAIASALFLLLGLLIVFPAFQMPPGEHRLLLAARNNRVPNRKRPAISMQAQFFPGLRIL